ncbi:immunoglobulin-like and fibronectin type III domain containing 1 [Cichlidogyrus casuarinus]|uniref:Immunoglobulin-like and fibronectin type III domain containing 1 n=1 Tax=Cichlidogyrus casuarinus TaxID=1844966 RepID=A0ABD2Q3Y1_9PLAT
MAINGRNDRLGILLYFRQSASSPDGVPVRTGFIFIVEVLRVTCDPLLIELHSLLYPIDIPGSRAKVQILPRIQPKFLDKPKIRKEGKNVIFEVNLQAEPKPEIQWSRDGHDVNHGGRYKVTCVTNGNDHKLALEVSELTAADGGEYQVFAKNKFGDSVATIHLNIGGNKAAAGKAPKFLDRPLIKFEKEKNQVLVICKLESKPAAELKYFQGEAEVQQIVGKREWTVRDVAEDTVEIEIRITAPKAEDGGVYKITAKNAHGDSNANINLNFQG